MFIFYTSRVRTNGFGVGPSQTPQRLQAAVIWCLRERYRSIDSDTACARALKQNNGRCTAQIAKDKSVHDVTMPAHHTLQDCGPDAVCHGKLQGNVADQRRVARTLQEDASPVHTVHNWLAVCRSRLSISSSSHFIRFGTSSEASRCCQPLSMAQRHEACNHETTYLRGSPIGQLFAWVTKSSPNHSHHGPSSRHDESESGCCAKVEEASIGVKEKTEGAPPSEGRSVQLQKRTPEVESRQQRHNEAHDWILARRVAVASIICLYT